MGKSPAFQFYPNDWLGSSAIMLMTPAEEGAYIRLLAIAWGSDDCGLPDDDEKLAVLSRLNEGWFKGGSTVLRQCFKQKDGRLYNERLLDEKIKQKNWREKSKRGGVQSGKQRKKLRKQQQNQDIKGGKGGCQMVGTKDEPKGNTSSSVCSLQSSSKKEINKRKYLDFVFLTDDEYSKLQNKFSETELKDLVERLNNYIGSKGKKYKSHYYTILAWARKDQQPTDGQDKDGPENDYGIGGLIL